MARYHELVESLRNPSEEGNPDSIYDDLTAEYDGLASGSEARIAEHTAANETLSAENAALKAKNYDLLMTVSGSDGPTEEVDDPDSVPTLDDLFTTEG